MDDDCNDMTKLVLSLFHIRDCLLRSHLGILIARTGNTRARPPNMLPSEGAHHPPLHACNI